MLAQLFSKLRDYRIAVFRRWWLWGLATVCMGSLGAWMQHDKPTLYTIRTSFLPEAKTGVANPLAALMATGSLDLGPAGSGNDMMIGVILSARLRKAIAADSLTLKGQRVRAATAFFQRVPPPKSLMEKLKIVNQRPISDTVGYMAQALAGCFTAKVDKYGYIEVLVTVPNKELAPAISEALIEQMSLYYRDQKTEKARFSLSYFNRKIDSVVKQLDEATFANAHYLDKYKFSPYAESFIPREKAVKKADYLQVIYSQLLVSREQAVAQLLDETPVIQVLDFPEESKVTRPKVFWGAIAGALIGMIMIMFFNAWRQIRSDITAYLSSIVPRQEEGLAAP